MTSAFIIALFFTVFIGFGLIKLALAFAKPSTWVWIIIILVVLAFLGSGGEFVSETRYG